jgi:hypothetical protein
MMAKPDVKNSCGCGRSPTGMCCGWHALTEDAYKQKLVEHEDAQVQKQRQDELEAYRNQAMSLWFDNGGSCTGAKGSGTPNIN